MELTRGERLLLRLAERFGEDKILAWSHALGRSLAWTVAALWLFLTVVASVTVNWVGMALAATSLILARMLMMGSD